MKKSSPLKRDVKGFSERVEKIQITKRRFPFYT